MKHKKTLLAQVTKDLNIAKSTLEHSKLRYLSDTHNSKYKESYERCIVWVTEQEKELLVLENPGLKVIPFMAYKRFKDLIGSDCFKYD